MLAGIGFTMSDFVSQGPCLRVWRCEKQRDLLKIAILTARLCRVLLRGFFAPSRKNKG